jgi:hypothetical protein
MALRLYLKTCEHPEIGVLCSAPSIQMLSAFWESHPQEIRPLAERLLAATDSRALTLGANLVTYCSYRGKLFEDLAEKCAEAGPAEKGGIARALATILLEEQGDTARAERDLAELFHDREPSVREAAAELFWRDGAFTTAAAPRIAKKVIASPVFLEIRDVLAEGLANAERPLQPFGPILTALARSYLDEARTGQRNWGGRDLGDALLRLYDESENDPATRSLCLDAWDMLLESGALGAEERLSRFD